MKLYTLFFYVLLLFSVSVLSAQNEIPYVENYSVESYHAGTQNWAVVQGKDGVMYFANNNGLLTFDGKKWNMHRLPSGGRLRSVYVNDDGRVYSGGFEEFGYWEKDAFGSYGYTSLSKNLKEFKMKNDEVWSIAKFKGVIYFQTFSSYFSYDGREITGKKLDFLPLSFIEAPDCIYVTIHEKGLYRFDGTRFDLLIDNATVGGNDITTVLPLGQDKLLVGVGAVGLFLYDRGKCSAWAKAYHPELGEAFINKAVMTRDSVCVVGSSHNGLYAFDSKQQLIWRINKDLSLGNNTVLGLCIDSYNNIWGGLDNGIAMVFQSSPFRFSANNLDKIGSVYALCSRPPFIYLGTNQGLYKYNSEEGGAVHVMTGLTGQVWDIADVDNQMICGHNDGAAMIEDTRLVPLSKINGGSCIRKFMHNGQEYLIQGTYTNLVIYRKGVDKKWNYSHTIDGFVNPVRQLEVDHQNNIWVSHVEKGLFRIRLSNDLKRAENIEEYHSLDSDSLNERMYVFKLGGRIVFANGKKLYTYNDLTNDIIPFDKLNEQLSEFQSLYRIIPVNNNRYWLVRDGIFALADYTGDKLTFLQKIPFSYLNNKLVGNYENVIEVADNTYIFCLENGIATYRYENERTLKQADCQLFFNSIGLSGSESGDRLLPLKTDKEVNFPYDKNYTISFDVSFPDYQHKNFYFKYRMKDLDEVWSMSADRSVFTYSRLPYGTYTFEVEVYSVSDKLLDRIEYTFQIDPPFYASSGALVLYVILLILLVVVIRFYISYQIRKNKRKIEQEKEKQYKEKQERQERDIIRLKNEKLEAEITHKSKEIASSTMHIINKNRVLQVLREELTVQKEALGTQYPNKYYKKLVSLIDENIGSDDDWDVFQTNFDCIHDGFFRKLKATYPELTANDLKLCAYLRLNLSTKDIANLMNISVRGVEMARYRIRKKLDIEAEENLVEFMIEFK